MGLVTNPLILSSIHFHKCQHGCSLLVRQKLRAESDLTKAFSNPLCLQDEQPGMGTGKSTLSRRRSWSERESREDCLRQMLSLKSSQIRFTA